MKYILNLLTILLFGQLTYGQCPTGETRIDVNINPDNWGNEITWTLTNYAGTITYGSGGPYTNGNTTPINTYVCVPTVSQVTFTIFDSYGDGICCSEGVGSYTVSVAGVNVATGGSFGSSESTSFFAPLLIYDLAVLPISSPFNQVGDNESVQIQTGFRNVSSSVVSSVNMSYQIDNQAVVTETISGLNVNPSEVANIEFQTLWQPTSTGMNTLKVWVNTINGSNLDLYNLNDTVYKPIDVYQGFQPIDRSLDFLAATPTRSIIANASQQVNKPTDLDIHPDISRNELWIINEDTENSGGSTVTISDFGLASQTSLYRRDGNAWHFMSLPTALSFGTNTNWASSPGVYDANHNGGAPFTGPTLWSSDMNVYAQNAGPGTNGSHLDMLHESPYAMGIDHHKDNAYWVFDGNSSDIVYYDFVEDHGPGMSYHGDAIIRRYPISVAKDNDLPSHLKMDKTSGWLYIVDNGNDRVLRMNTNTGTVASALNGYEAVAEYSQMTNVTSEVVIDTGLVRPCGIDIVGNSMIIGDYSTGYIRFYDISSNPAVFQGQVSTGFSGLTGLKIGPSGNIWYTNRLTNEVGMLSPSVTTDVNHLQASQWMNVFPNPATDIFNVYLDTRSTNNTIQVFNTLGELILNLPSTNDSTIQIDGSNWSKGMYLIRCNGDWGTTTKRVVLTK